MAARLALRGGARATRSRLAHAGFRIFDLPGRHDPFVGFRTCAVAPGGGPVAGRRQ